MFIIVIAVAVGLAVLIGTGLIASEIAMNKHVEDVMKHAFDKW